MTVTKRLKLKLILLMLSSCSFAQHVPMTAMSPEPGVSVSEEEKMKGDSAFASASYAEVDANDSHAAQASGGDVGLPDEDDESVWTDEDPILDEHQLECTRYWKHEQRSTTM